MFTARPPGAGAARSAKAFPRATSRMPSISAPTEMRVLDRMRELERVFGTSGQDVEREPLRGPGSIPGSLVNCTTRFSTAGRSTPEAYSSALKDLA